MKRILSMLLVALLLLAVPLPQAEAAAQPEEQVVYLEDGGYLVITTTEQECRAINQRSGSRTYKYYGDNNALRWSATLSGTFQYDGTVAVCTDANCTVTFYSTSYAQSSKTVTRQGATARADLVIKHIMLGITVSEHLYTFTLTCDPHGNLS